MPETGRCQASHTDDPTPCQGPHDAVLIRDQQMSRARDTMTEGMPGCVHHGARMLASLDGGRVNPGPGDPGGAALEVYKLAQALRPYEWRHGK